MGWLTFHKPKGVKAVDAILDSVGRDWAAKKVVAKSATREAVFLVVREAEPSEYLKSIYEPEPDGSVKGICVFKLSIRPRDEYNFGYKDMDETSGPYGCECPPSIIAAASKLRPLVGEDNGEYSGLRSAHEYRARSLRAAELRAKKRGLKSGTYIRLAEPLNFGGKYLDTFRVERHRTRTAKNGTYFRSVATGTLCNIPASRLANSEVIEVDLVRAPTVA